MASINGTKVNNASMFDIQTYFQAGIDPKTGLPLKVSGCLQSELKDNIKKNLRILDEQQAIGRYRWFNLPAGLTGDIIERVLYYKGQGMFFYMKENETFYFLPYCLDGNIDVYGRWTAVTPLPFTGTQDKDSDKIKPWIQGLIKKPVYGIKLDELKLSDLEDSCVLISDYSKQLSQTVLPRQRIIDPILDLEADCLPFMRTALMNSTGISGMRVNGTDEYTNVLAANKSIEKAALNGERYVPIISNIEFQDLTSSTGNADLFLQGMEAIDNFRLSLYGLPNGGLFNKGSYQNTAEVGMNVGPADLPLQDGLKVRQEACDIINSIWGLGVYCDLSESAVQTDLNMDGIACSEQDQSGTMEGDQDVML